MLTLSATKILSMNYNFSSLIILLVAVLLLVLNETLLPGQIPAWTFVVLLVIWFIVKVRTFRKMRK